MAGVEFVMQLRYYDADGNPKVLEGEAANRVVSFSNAYVGTVDNTSKLPRLVIAPRVPLEDRVTALENKLNGTTPITDVPQFGTIKVESIKEAVANGKLKILTNDGQECARFGTNGGNVAMLFYGGGGAMSLQQFVDAGTPTVEEVANVVISLGLAATT